MPGEPLDAPEDLPKEGPGQVTLRSVRPRERGDDEAHPRCGINPRGPFHPF